MLGEEMKEIPVESQREAGERGRRRETLQPEVYQPDSLTGYPPPSLSPEPPSLSDRDLLAGALEVVVILWEGQRETLEGHERLHSRLVSSVAGSLPLLFNTLTVRRSTCPVSGSDDPVYTEHCIHFAQFVDWMTCVQWFLYVLYSMVWCALFRMGGAARLSISWPPSFPRGVCRPSSVAR